MLQQTHNHPVLLRPVLAEQVPQMNEPTDVFIAQNHEPQFIDSRHDFSSRKIN